jgi:Outer membrane protein and related peptidoglycan-associated (lipo)proteins
MNRKTSSIPVRFFLQSFLFLFIFLSSFLPSGCLPPVQEQTPIPEATPLPEATPQPSPTIDDIEMEGPTTELKIELSGDVLFDFGKSDIRPTAESILQKVADVINKYPDASVLIEGHTDSIGSDSYNLRLSQRRADAIKGWLVEEGGVDGRRIETKGWGESKPVVSNTTPDGSDNPEGRQENRRVEITVKKQ